MRVRGVVFERFGAFERAEVNLCDEAGAPLDVVLFVGETGSGKTTLLRGIAALLGEAAGAPSELEAVDVRRPSDAARCRIVFDDHTPNDRVVITVEKELPARGTPAPASALPSSSFERWRSDISRTKTPRAAFSLTSDLENADEAGERDDDPGGGWLSALGSGPSWDQARRTIDHMLWPFALDHIDAGGELVFARGGSLYAAGELGEAFGSVLVMTLELLRLSLGRAPDELVYVVDDLDAHLHPRWQGRLIGDLRRAFPRVQLIATTHSPFVVAAVEPHQVFRLADGAITRVSDRVQRGAVSSSVMDLAFGAPDLAGPRWAHVPPFAVRHEVLDVLRPDLTRSAVVHALPEPVHVKDVRDAFGEPALPITEGVRGYLFFVDLEPGVAWGHPCEYVFRSHDGKLVRQRAIWPPIGLERFVPVGRG